MQQITVLGSTGSVGVNTLDVLSRHQQQYRVYALTAATRWQLLAEQCIRFAPEYAVIVDERFQAPLREALSAAGSATQVLTGARALEEVASAGEVDTVMAAIVGGAGLLPTFAAASAGKKLLLANKEVLVMAGGLFMRAARASGATILPIDSEHNAIFQCLPLMSSLASGLALSDLGVRRLLLTASGGPFRTWSVEQLAQVTPAQACAHPNWEMGRKISVDSATMMNKGLEFIEACWLFNAAPADIEVLIHPQSVVHSLVEYIDGSVLAQLGNPDMRIPIAHALAWPQRVDSGATALDLVAAARLDFEAPDMTRFTCLGLAQQAAVSGGMAPVVLNAANEEAVAAFLAGSLGFERIAGVIESTLAEGWADEPTSLEAVQNADALTRNASRRIIAGIS
ncbi:MAG TPA: 1-deoxy-D-xylulose-5-phosphate reductoisomerase [Cellvibrionaceae bacterium]